MTTAPRYYIEPARGCGDAYSATSLKDAFAIWNDDHSQTVTMVEFDGTSFVGRAFDMTEYFREMVLDNEREAHAWNRHCQSYARAS